MHQCIEQPASPVAIGSQEDEVTVLDRRDDFGLFHDRKVALDTRFAVGTADHAAREIDLFGGEALTERAKPFRTTLVDQPGHPIPRSEEPRVGKACGSTGRFRWSPDHYKT